jgi:hypothetical protein
MQARATLLEGGPPPALYLCTSTCGRQAGVEGRQEEQLRGRGAAAVLKTAFCVVRSSQIRCSRPESKQAC